jgi:predicted nucleic-acid-binding protein
MKIADANVVLRYLLADVSEFFSRSKALLENEEIHIPLEVLAEIVYVLEKVYNVPRKDASGPLLELLKYPNISTHDPEVATCALKAYSDTGLDFVDMLLYAYHQVRNFEIVSYDRKLLNFMQKKS